MKKNKKIIGIDINEILRARWIQFDRFYVEEFGEEGVPSEEEAYVYDYWNSYKWEDKEEEVKYLKEDIPEDISPLDYQLDEKGESNVDFLAFTTEKLSLTAREVYNRFLYEDYCYEIFGAAPKMYQNIDKDAEKFYSTFNDQFEIALISKENWFSIPPTLFFLSKVTPRFSTYFFHETNEEIWDRVDYLVTTDPELIKSKQKGKKVVKLNRPYNEKENADLSRLNLIDLIEDQEFKKLINYKKTKK